ARAVAILLAILGSSPSLSQQPDPEDRNDAIVPGLEEEGEGAPSRAGLGKVAIVTDLAENDPWYAAVKGVAAAGPAEPVAVRPWSADAAFERLARIKPEFVVCVFAPERIDVAFHFDFLERASRLDRDPFVDFAFGYVTGATPDEARDFAARVCAAKKTAVA